jgi:hypothetical protein
MSDEPRAGHIERPKKSGKNKFARHAAKAAAGTVPYAGAILTELTDAVVPDHEARDRARWEGEVTDGVNSLHGRVDDLHERTGKRRATITGAAAAIAKYMVEHCPDGMLHDWVTIAEVQAVVPDFDQGQLLDGFGDLESYDLIESRSLVNAPTRYRLCQHGYEMLDGQIMGWRTEDDAREIAALVVKKREGIRAADLATELNWPRRRLNPALRIVVGFVGPGRVSQENQWEYVTRHFTPSNAELAELRRFAAGS